ncbi:MAG: glutaminyl-peptide cyclotransferase, partial [Acidobacteria bacterium Pan2503]|nr:glutaminyl-peptide cyclotransferase [Candidatus Acidoferrum panamensis]
MRILVVTIAIATYACAPVSQAGVPEYTYEVVHSYPHDRTAFTEGLFYLDGFLYESTGIEGASSVRKVRLETGEVVQRHDLPSAYFGEGIIHWKDRLIQLTYKTEVGFVYNLSTFETERRFEYPGEGWAMTQDGKNIFMSDGTAQIRIWDPETLQELRRITVTDQGQPVPNVNELEWVKGEIYANIWETDRIARIDPATGRVVGWIDLAGLLNPNERISGPEGTDVLNGIAYDAKGNRLFVTGKRWP